MAYRQLRALTFAVLGWVTVGCSGGSGANAAPDPVDEHPPANSDQPINNATDHTGNADQAPANPDQPPRNPDGLPSTGGGGGNAEAACRAFCDGIKGKDCTGPSGLGGITGLVCASGCVLSAEDQACASQIAAAISCLSSLQGLCTDDFKADQAKDCKAAFDAASSCDDAHNPPTDNTNDNQSCTLGGGCACGGDACLTCGCQAGTNVDALAACATGACQ